MIGEDTSRLQEAAPRAWRYLTDHREYLDRRGSSIYRNRPPFSIFGIGDCSFSPWKVAISGLYKRLSFAVVAPHADRPVVFDDTVYFLPCESEEMARRTAGLLNSERAQDFLSAVIFWDAKRPITAQVLNRLDLTTLAQGRSGGQNQMELPWIRRVRC